MHTSCLDKCLKKIAGLLKVVTLFQVIISSQGPFYIEHHIGGAVFLDFSEDDWKEFGISKVGLFYIRRIKEKVNLPTWLAV